MGNTCKGRRTDGEQVTIIALPELAAPVVSPSIVIKDGDALPVANVSDGGGDQQSSSAEAPLAVQSVISKPPEPVKIVSTKAVVARDAAKPLELAEAAGQCSNSGEARTAVLNYKTESVEEKYILGRRLGHGQFGTTYLCVERSTGEEFACKSILKRKLVTDGDVEDVRREIQIMHHLAGHPNVIAIRGAYEDAIAVHLVMELCTGGELFDRIKQQGHYKERKASELARNIVAGVEICHSMGVMHGDLKPENFLFVDNTEDSALKMIDFGFSVFFRPGQVFTDIVGSIYYVAPEVLKGKYGPEADVWSAGVIFYILLSGVPPFWADNDEDTSEQILHGRLHFQSYPWPSISESTKALVRGMLRRDPRKRLTAHEVLRRFDSSTSMIEDSAKLDSTNTISMGTTETKYTARKASPNLNISSSTSQPSATGSKSLSSSTPQPAFSIMGFPGDDQMNVEDDAMADDTAAPMTVQPAAVFQFLSQQGGGRGGDNSSNRRVSKIRRAHKKR